MTPVNEAEPPPGFDTRRRTLVALVVASALLLAYSATRAAVLSFTHDESLSYSIAAGEPTWSALANHHPLNTLLMRWALAWLGDAEWALRLPNVLAHALYLACSVGLLARLQMASGVALGFALLHLDPFLLDFFGLARGYGLASALALAALFALRLAWESSSPGRVAALAALSQGLAGLACFANYAWVNLQVPLLAGWAIVLWRKREWRRSRATWGTAGLLATGNALLLGELARRVLRLRAEGELYDGGHEGFVQDTLRSLVETWLYEAPWSAPSATPLMILVIAGLAWLGFAVGMRLRRDGELSFSALLLLVLALAVAMPIAAHAALGTLYPRDRSALYYLPLAALFVAYSVTELASGARASRRRVAGATCWLLTTGLLLHFLVNANLGHTLLWRYDATTKAAVRELERLPRAPDTRLRLGGTWLFEPALNYYRLTLQLDWLLPVTRAAPTAGDYDALYVFSAWAPKPPTGFVVERCFPESGACLLSRAATGHPNDSRPSGDAAMGR